jgi:hypothetical protein
LRFVSNWRYSRAENEGENWGVLSKKLVYEFLFYPAMFVVRNKVLEP